MQGRTHRVGGVLCALLGYSFLEARGMLIPDVEPLVQLAVVYPFAMYGAIVSDLDHHWESTPSKDPISWVINKVLHLASGKMWKPKVLKAFDAKHRSWQTHSDIIFLLAIGLIIYLMVSPVISVTSTIVKLMLLGFSVGIVSHMLLDAITPEGIWLIGPSIIRKKRVTLSLVPHTKFFSTGGPWERLIRIAMWFFIIVLLLYVLYKASPYRFSIHY